MAHKIGGIPCTAAADAAARGKIVADAHFDSDVHHIDVVAADDAVSVAGGMQNGRCYCCCICAEHTLVALVGEVLVGRS